MLQFLHYVAPSEIASKLDGGAKYAWYLAQDFTSPTFEAKSSAGLLLVARTLNLSWKDTTPIAVTAIYKIARRSGSGIVLS